MNRTYPLFIRLIPLCLLVGILSGCYRMPGENDFSVVPTTNNPAITCEKNNSMMPSATY